MELHVYDFDGTLFKSPFEPDWWGDENWWTSPESLDPPCIPESPSSDWWVPSVVNEAKKSIAHPDVIAILLTGRQDNFTDRVNELLEDVGLSFDGVHLNPGEDTPEFKKRIIRQYLAKHPDIEVVHIWEDRPEHLEEYDDMVEDMDKESVPHEMETQENKSLCKSRISRVCRRLIISKRVLSKFLE